MSETQVQEAVNDAPVPDADAAAIAEQQAELDAIDNPEPEVKEEPKPEPEPEKPAQNGQIANLNKALAESRYNQRQTQRQLREMREAMAQMKPNQQVDPEQQIHLDPDNDPIGTLRYVTARLRAYEHQEAERVRVEQEQQQEAQAMNTLTTYMADNEQLARSEFPDYDAAVQYQVQSRAAELKALGYQESDIGALVKNEYMGLINQAYQNGQNPAFLVYQQAKARGFTAPAPEPAPDTPQPTQGGAKQQIEALREGQQTPSTGRGGGGGGGKSGTVTIEMLNNAKSDREFNELFMKYEKQNS
jgi:uncharacterized coiled-coil protein SlyX